MQLKIRFFIFGGLINQLFFVLADESGWEDAYEYDTDYSSNETEKPGKGNRLIGAKAASSEDLPFSVAWSGHVESKNQEPSVGCSGSLIHPKWFLTASHCYLPFGHGIEDDDITYDCIEQTKVKKGFEIDGFKIKCRILKETGDLVLIPQNQVPVAWLGIGDVYNHNTRLLNTGVTESVIRIVKPKYRYRGGSAYGKFGGYDIALAELKKRTNLKKVCLPSPNFDDKQRSILTGYGKYIREIIIKKNKVKICQTDDVGPLKAHYCDPKDSCKNSPAPRSEECKKFFSHPSVPKHILDEDHEIIIVKTKDPKQMKDGAIYCFKDEKKNNFGRYYGWCKVLRNNYDINAKKNVEPDLSWGFCSDECFLDDQNLGKLRKKNNVSVLSDEMCKEYLVHSVDKDVLVMPRVLCVGIQKKWQYGLWIQTEDGYEKASKELTNSSIDAGLHFGQTWPDFSGYIYSPGTCEGDSGGPMIVDEDPLNYVVTGVASGGRGIGRCGGINNPVHYVRVKMFSYWIAKLLGPLELCWDNQFNATINEKIVELPRSSKVQ